MLYWYAQIAAAIDFNVFSSIYMHATNYIVMKN